MSTIYADILGVKLLSESVGGGTGSVAEITYNMPAYTASTDSGKIGTIGTNRGATNAATLATIIQNQRRDGKTVTIGNPPTTNVSLAITAESGLQGSTQYYAGGFALSSGSLTFNLCQSDGTEIDALSGVSDRPIRILVSYTTA